MVFANASNSGLSGSLRLGFHSLTCGFVADTLGYWLTLFFVIFLSTHHFKLSIDLVLLEDLLVLLLHLHQDGVDEVVAVGCNRPNLQRMM